MKKRLLSTLLALCMVIALLPGTVSATVSSTDVRYDLSGSGDILYFDASTGTITGCSAGGESFRDVLNIGRRRLYNQNGWHRRWHYDL